MKSLRHSLLFFVCIAATLFSCKTENKKIVKTAAIEFKKEGTLTIRKGDKDSVLTKINIEIAETEYETQTGLMYRKGMATNEGMLFIFPDVRMHSFYMKNTQFPLDIIYIDENLKIASFQENAKPLDETSLSSIVPVKYVLEVNAGLAEKWILEVGDTVEFTKL
ncbi:DUF192 domain-containing protein [uncultured Maribacter sp.]|uniref:DUF192 domain-containing protein n=1 Tax=uncultured Maribacter sp. TaxID=431308 RepID=UPI00262D73C1|nr:DUF192 domain-containing protein [uncultured Maribacter sp.]